MFGLFNKNKSTPQPLNDTVPLMIQSIIAVLPIQEKGSLALSINEIIKPYILQNNSDPHAEARERLFSGKPNSIEPI